MTIFDYLKASFGEDVALQMCCRWNGQYIPIPRTKGYGRRAKLVRFILSLFRSGAPLQTIAADVNLSVNTVVDIVEEEGTFSSAAPLTKKKRKNWWNSPRGLIAKEERRQLFLKRKMRAASKLLEVLDE